MWPQVFKRLFPPDFFAAFIDVGHYVAPLTAYTGLADRLAGEGSDVTLVVNMIRLGVQLAAARTSTC